MSTFCVVTLIMLGCTTVLDAQSSQRNVRSQIDSVTLQRTACLGSCPAYRLRVRADGFVAFVSHNRGESGRTESQSLGPTIMRRIEQELNRVEFDALPEMVVGRGPYCRVVATDAPTITVAVFRANSVRTISYYTGCRGESAADTVARSFIRRLRVFADSIDAIAAGDGWIRPSRCCDI